MISLALTIFTVSVFVFGTLLFVTSQEQRRGRRFFASKIRTSLDRVVDAIGQSLSKNLEHFSKYMVQLGWYYSIHSVLRTVLKGIVALYTYFEQKFEKNRLRTKQLRTEKKQLSEYNHLRQMALHREETALTATEKKKLKKRELEGKG